MRVGISLQWKMLYLIVGYRHMNLWYIRIW